MKVVFFVDNKDEGRLTVVLLFGSQVGVAHCCAPRL
jgi:hypothetical protein